MSQAKVQVEVPGVDVQEMVRAVIADKITAALVGSDEAIAAVVTSVVMEKVDSRGSPSRSYGKPRIEYLAEKAVIEATKTALQKHIEAMAPKLEKQIEACLKRSSNKLARAMVADLVKASNRGYAYRLNVSVNPTED